MGPWDQEEKQEESGERKEGQRKGQGKNEEEGGRLNRDGRWFRGRGRVGTETGREGEKCGRRRRPL